MARLVYEYEIDSTTASLQTIRDSLGYSLHMFLVCLFLGYT